MALELASATASFVNGALLQVYGGLNAVVPAA
jgi:hypothetical protein